MSEKKGREYFDNDDEDGLLRPRNLLDAVRCIFHRKNVVPSFVIINLESQLLEKDAVGKTNRELPDYNTYQTRDKMEFRHLRAEIQLLGGSVRYQPESSYWKNIPIIYFTSDPIFDKIAFSAWRAKEIREKRYRDAFHENFIHEIFRKGVIGNLNKYRIGRSLFPNNEGRRNILFRDLDWREMCSLPSAFQYTTPSTSPESGAVALALPVVAKNGCKGSSRIIRPTSGGRKRSRNQIKNEPVLSPIPGTPSSSPQSSSSSNSSVPACSAIACCSSSSSESESDHAHSLIKANKMHPQDAQERFTSKRMSCQSDQKLSAQVGSATSTRATADVRPPLSPRPRKRVRYSITDSDSESLL